MMTQEDMDVMGMKRRGLSIKEIAEETDCHPSRHGMRVTVASVVMNLGSDVVRR